MTTPTAGPGSWDTVGVFSSGMARIPAIATLLGARRVVLRPSDARSREVDAVVGWGQKPTSRTALAYARRHDLPFWRAEDGFLRSVGLGVGKDPPLSIVLDDLGVYYDARSESRLERLIGAGDGRDRLADPALLERALRAIEVIRAAGLSKYNDAPPAPIDLGPPRRRVLVVDQTAGDLSVRCGLSDASTFGAMLAAALGENPDAEIVIKTHPDVLAGAKRGYLERSTDARVRVWARQSAPAELFAAVDRVYVVTSQLGFEALLWNKAVTCFGAPWYAGWGATDDRVAIQRRGRRRGVEELFAAAYLLYARYLEPASTRAGEIEQVIEHLALQRATFARNQGNLYCFGFRFWKRGYMRSYLRCPGSRVEFCSGAAAAERAGIDANARIVVWGQRESEGVRRLASRHGIPICRVEDGFLRSVGLGSDLTVPASLVFDREGIYYDPTRPSELESLLQNADLTVAEVERAALLRRRLLESGLSKYNVGLAMDLPVPAGPRVILVPGQVEDDASIRLGCVDVRTNLGLIEAVRHTCPDAFVIYKPHPDVLSGNRRGAVDRANALALCDHVEEAASIALCLQKADEVHTMTSLVGFEALLRGKRVVVYGQPFYAGWGLTEDRHPVDRRTRRRTIDELVACALLRYPRYLDRRTGQFTTPEATIEALLAERVTDGTVHALDVSWARRQLRKVFHAYRGLVNAP
ncbi:MAG: capsular polysaccharide biosynthesis protein [Deltaproteobacteria bacterium]|nr:capsular polysaccharide biosynthesis protein [Deltaproteobacteria bacterium]